MKTYKKVLDETVNYYKSNPRGLVYNSEGLVKGCAYLNAEGHMCAVGRVFNKEGLKLYGNYTNDFRSLLSEVNIENNFTDFFKKKYQHLTDLNFWTLLQDLHDDSNYWENNKLTKEGKTQLKRIKQQFK
jgi:hypothetical protein